VYAVNFSDELNPDVYEYKEFRKMKKASQWQCFVLVFILLGMTFTSTAWAQGTATFRLKSATPVIQQGEPFVVIGNIDSTLDVAVFDLKVIYDTGKLTYVSAKGIGLDSAGELDIVPNEKDGKVQFLYLDNMGGLTSIKAHGADVFEMTFIPKTIGATTIQVVIDAVGEISTQEIKTTAVPLQLTIGQSSSPQETADVQGTISPQGTTAPSSTASLEPSAPMLTENGTSFAPNTTDNPTATPTIQMPEALSRSRNWIWACLLLGGLALGSGCYILVRNKKKKQERTAK